VRAGATHQPAGTTSLLSSFEAAVVQGRRPGHRIEAGGFAQGCVDGVDVNDGPLSSKTTSPVGSTTPPPGGSVPFPVVGGIVAARLLTVLKRIGGEGDSARAGAPRARCSS